MDIEDYVYFEENFLDPKTLKKLNKYIVNDIEWEKARVVAIGKGKNELNEKLRKVQSKFITNVGDEKATSIFWYNFMRFRLLKFTQKYYEKVNPYHRAICPILEMNVLKYEKNNFFTPHVDYHRTTPRNLSYIFSLNDDYEGGQLTFHFKKDQKKTLKLNKNACVIFPSNFLFTHHVNPVTEGERYVIVSWMP